MISRWAYPPLPLHSPQRTNPTDIPASSFVPAAAILPGQAAPPPKKKQTGNVRKLLYARKTLKDWLEELVRGSFLRMF